MTWNQPNASGIKQCPRCGARFDCKVDALEQCDCIDIELTLPLLQRLQQEYDDCLCPHCLRQLAESAGAAETA